MERAPAIGIDLGNTNSCVAVFQNGKVEIIPNKHGNRTTYSYVAFTGTQTLIGDAAKSQANRNPSNTLFSTKRLVGRKFEDTAVQSDMKDLPFEIVCHGDKPTLKFVDNGVEKQFYPEKISSMMLNKMKELAEAYLQTRGTRVLNAVIAVPSSFNYAQRQAMSDAATSAGLNVLRFITEPVAATIAYGLENENHVKDERILLTFDMGSGHLNVSIVTIQDGIFEVKSTASNSHLGGDDFDKRMVNHVTQEFKRKYKKDLKTNKRALRRLRTACERAKRTLSSSTVAFIELDFLLEGINFYTSIIRARFEELNADLFRKTLKSVEKALQDAKMDKSQIHEILLTGGSSRIPRIQTLLKDFFDGKKLNKYLNADESVAHGAAIMAAIINNDESENIQDLLLLDATSYSVGIETAGGVMTTVIKRNSSIPKNQRMTVTTSSENQSVILIQVYEGERALTKYNTLLGIFELSDIPPAPAGVPEIDILFDIDKNSVLKVTAMDQSTGKKNCIEIGSDENSRNVKIHLESLSAKENLSHYFGSCKEFRYKRNNSVDKDGLVES